jgi:hypothetical protein
MISMPRRSAQPTRAAHRAFRRGAIHRQTGRIKRGGDNTPTHTRFLPNRRRLRRAASRQQGRRAKTSRRACPGIGASATVAVASTRPRRIRRVATVIRAQRLSVKLLLWGTFRPPRIFVLAGMLAAGRPLGVASMPAKNRYLEGFHPSKPPFLTVSELANPPPR